jgi:thiamine-monophosphate kinase
VTTQASVPGEFDLIRRFFVERGAGAATDGVVLGIGDDAALLEVPQGSELVVSVDTVVEGRHFPSGTDAASIGHRALAVNLSDMAAMGATPAWITLALTLPRVDERWLQGFADGLFCLADLHRVALVGGDTTRGALTVSIQVMGHVPRGLALRRGGARPGDVLLVSGTLGDAGAGLALRLAEPGLSAPARSPEALQLIHRFEYPTPRVSLGLAARGIASAAMDISDGMIGDAEKLAAASGVAAHVEIEKLPLSAALRAGSTLERARELAMSAGDDYELLLCAPPAQVARLESAASRLNLTLTRVGEMRTGSGVHCTLNGDGFSPRSKGYDHFDRGSTQITD